MSAYSASPPVTVSTTAPRISTACQSWVTKKCQAQNGFSAASTDGFWAML